MQVQPIDASRFLPGDLGLGLAPSPRVVLLMLGTVLVIGAASRTLTGSRPGPYARRVLAASTAFALTYTPATPTVPAALPQWIPMPRQRPGDTRDDRRWDAVEGTAGAVFRPLVALSHIPGALGLALGLPLVGVFTILDIDPRSILGPSRVLVGVLLIVGLLPGLGETWLDGIERRVTHSPLEAFALACLLINVLTPFTATCFVTVVRIGPPESLGDPWQPTALVIACVAWALIIARGLVSVCHSICRRARIRKGVGRSHMSPRDLRRISRTLAKRPMCAAPP